MRPGQLLLQVVLEPLLGLMLLTLGTVAVATGMMDAVWLPTAWALREAKLVDINFYISLHFKSNDVVRSKTLQNIFYSLE